MPTDFSASEHNALLDNANAATTPVTRLAQTQPAVDKAVSLGPKTDLVRTAHLLAAAMNEHTNFTRDLGMVYSYEDGRMVGRFDLADNLLGNPNFRILHGGVAATMLDTIGGLEAMIEIFRRDQGTQEEKHGKVKRLATVDLRIDYLAPGRGKQFIATAEVIRMGRKGCTTRMMMYNDEGKAIAHGMASYAY